MCIRDSAWTVRDAGNSVIASETGSDLDFTWTASANPGTYVVEADLVLGETIADLGQVEVVVAGEAVAEAPTATPEATAEATPAATATSGGQPAATAAPSANLGDPGDATAVVNAPINVRTGPGINYGTIAGGAGAGTLLQLIGRNETGSWLNVTLPGGAAVSYTHLDVYKRQVQAMAAPPGWGASPWPRKLLSAAA